MYDSSILSLETESKPLVQPYPLPFDELHIFAVYTDIGPQPLENCHFEDWSPSMDIPVVRLTFMLPVISHIEYLWRDIDVLGEDFTELWGQETVDGSYGIEFHGVDYRHRITDFTRNTVGESFASATLSAESHAKLLYNAATTRLARHAQRARVVEMARKNSPFQYEAK